MGRDGRMSSTLWHSGDQSECQPWASTARAMMTFWTSLAPS
jgi:hypothetical protein